MKKKILSLALALVMTLALAVPAFAVEVRSGYCTRSIRDDGTTSSLWSTLGLEIDREPIATYLPWSVEDSLPIFTVSVGTTIQSASHALSPNSDAPLREISEVDSLAALVIDRFTRPDGNVLNREDAEEMAALLNLDTWEDGMGAYPNLPWAMMQAGLYHLMPDVLGSEAYVRVIAPGDPYEVTVLAQPNGLQAKLNAERVTAQSTVSYNGQQIPLYMVLPGSADAGNLYLKQADGAAYVVNTYTAKNSGGTLTDIEAKNTYEFTGEDGYYYRWQVNGDDASVFEIAENGVVIQTVALLPVAAETGKPVEAGTYTAKRYDTWGQLALNNYGTYAVWPQLMKVNGNKAVKAGMVITLPEKLGSYTRLPAQVLAEGEQFYTVKAGDTLGIIAANYYGNIKRYIDIFNRNSDRLKNANMIYEGQILVLPAKK